MPLNIIRNDITKMQVDAIVNAANTSLRAGGGVCGAIFSAAGADRLQKACDDLAPIQTGQAVITKGFALPAKYIIHAAGPVYRDGKSDEEKLLRSCYKNALDLALKHKCKSIAFPLISSGIYGYPKDEALNVATSAIGQWLMADDIDVSLVVFDKAAFSISRELLGQVRAFIEDNYVDERTSMFGRGRFQPLAEALPDPDAQLFDTYADAGDESGSLPAEESIPSPAKPSSAADIRGLKTFDAAALPEIQAGRETPKTAPMISASAKKQLKAPSIVPAAMRKGNLGDVISRLDEPFSATLFRLIDAKGKTDVEIYKRANLDRKLFSKIRTGKGYMPSKKTVAALAVALELSLPETRDLMERAGFALSRSVVFDVIIEYFITRRKYDIFEINNVLFEYDQPILGG